MSIKDKEMEQGGAIANKHGKILEQTLLPLFQKQGYEVVENPKKHYDDIVASVDKLVIKNAPYTSIYGTAGKTEYLLINNKTNRKIRIECKWQQSPGSVDEKFPYLYLNCIQTFEEKEIIIIVDGGGQKPKSIEWLKKACENNLLNEGAKKTIKVMNLSEFLKWFNDQCAKKEL